jgi:hypothetical protein
VTLKKCRLLRALEEPWNSQIISIDCHPNTQESDLIMPAVVTQAILTSKGVTSHAKEKSGHLPSCYGK